MLLDLKCPLGGRPLKGYQNLDIDRETSVAGYKIGYLPRDAKRGEPVLIPLKECGKFIDDLQVARDPKITLRARIATYLAGESGLQASKPNLRQHYAIRSSYNEQ